MTLTIGTASGAKEVSEIYVGVAGGTASVTEGWIGTASGAKQFYSAVPAPPPPSPPVVSVSPTVLSWNVVVPGTYYVSSGDASVSVHSGVGPFSYAWEGLAGATGINDYTSATTTFYSGDGYGVQFRCLVTDNGTGLWAYTDPVDIS